MRNWKSLPSEAKEAYAAGGTSFVLAAGCGEAAHKFASLHENGWMAVSDAGIALGLFLGAYFITAGKEVTAEFEPPLEESAWQAEQFEHIQHPELGTIRQQQYDPNGPQY